MYNNERSSDDFSSFAFLFIVFTSSSSFSFHFDYCVFFHFLHIFRFKRSAFVSDSCTQPNDSKFKRHVRNTFGAITHVENEECMNKWNEQKDRREN